MTRTFLHQDLSKGRWIPSWLRFQQSMRYQWAAEFVTNRNVLEVGCGGGAGCQMLSASGTNHTTGVDVDAASIESARERYESPQVQFDVVHNNSLPVDDNSVDVVVALETIEHVNDDVNFVDELARVLRPGGVLLLSTPNRLLTNPGLSIADQPVNPLHIREYQQFELQELLSARFEKFAWYGQTFYSPRILAALTAVSHVSRAAAVRVRQSIRLAWGPFDAADLHKPQLWYGHNEPEVMLTVCHRKHENEISGGGQTNG